MSTGEQNEELVRYINLKLAALGKPISHSTAEPEFLELAGPLLRNYYRKGQLLGDRLCPADGRIQEFLNDYLAGVDIKPIPRLPALTFTLDREGMARTLSLPPDADKLSSPYLQSFRVKQGVLHNPRSDRRTTQGIFHIVEGGIPVPADKIEVPKITFARLLAAALNPPTDVMALPFTATQADQVHTFVTLMLRPLVCPATGSEPEKRMETRFFVPGSLVSNLDFVEEIFGNAGDPDLPENDSALDFEHWTGHTGCVILAPSIAGLKKIDLGLPHYDQATERQRADGMCWRDEDELYNNGGAFKMACRDVRGVMVTLIADNYFGYCKKEVKTQISYSANLFGMAEEEHAGGATAFPAYVLGPQFYAGRTVLTKKVTFREAMNWLDDRVTIHPEDGYATDNRYSWIIYVPENAEFSVHTGTVEWDHPTGRKVRTLRADETYFLPWGTKIRLQKQIGGSAWRLVAVRADGILCHKPCTVSGGGKSEISKSIGSIVLKGPIFVNDFQGDLDRVAEIVDKDFSGIYKNAPPSLERARRTLLSSERSLGSVIKLLTPSTEYTDEHNEWVAKLRPGVRQLVITVKRYYRQDWGGNWREYFSVDHINGSLGNELKFQNQKMLANYLRMGYDPDGSWRIFKLRPDFLPADKVQMEDDITASVVLPKESLNNLDPEYRNPSVKLVQNCENRLFQRPDDAVHRGFDKDAEADLAAPGNFISNFEPLDAAATQKIVDEVVEFDQFSGPMKRLLQDFVRDPHPAYVVSSAQARIVDGAPSKNPRYLQKRPDLVHPEASYVAEIGTRLAREIPPALPAHFPVNAVLSGRRNNPREPKSGVPPLAVYNPIHYQELPELFMDFISSLTGKSPSTTGFGSEGALTKGPFNALPPVIDVNNALVSYVVTNYAGFTTAAGHIGPKYKVDHDNSMLVPELWCRMRTFEREPEFLIRKKYLERLEDFEYQGRQVLASRLGYRITAEFVDAFLGRIFEVPGAVFPAELLKPELQGMEDFVAGIEAMVESQRAVALLYMADGSVEQACPPIRALLHVMAYGNFNGMTEKDPEFRAMFTREHVLASDWYKKRLETKQAIDLALWKRHAKAAQDERRKTVIERRIVHISSAEYLKELVGTIGADPSVRSN